MFMKISRRDFSTVGYPIVIDLNAPVGRSIIRIRKTVAIWGPNETDRHGIGRNLPKNWWFCPLCK